MRYCAQIEKSGDELKVRLLPLRRREYAEMRREFSVKLCVFIQRLGGGKILSITFSSLPEIEIPCA